MPSGLANLAHVCSHLQNVSRARLTKTSIPLTRRHLRLALALQEQGFLSTVEIGGKGKAPVPQKETAFPRFADVLTYPEYNKLIRLIQEPGHEVLREAQPWAWTAKDAEELAANFRRNKATSPDTPDAHGPINSDDDLEKRMPTNPSSPVEPMLTPEEYNERPWMLTFSGKKRIPVRQVLDFPHLLLKLKDQELLSHEAWQTRTNVLAHGYQSINPAELAAQPWRCYPDPSPYFVGHRTSKDPWLEIPENPASRRLWLGLKYWRNEPVIHKCHVVSTGSRMVNMCVSAINRVVKGLDTPDWKGLNVRGFREVGECMYFQTSGGVLEARNCLKWNVGGLALIRIS